MIRSIHSASLLLACLAAFALLSARAQQPCLQNAWAAMKHSNYQQAFEAADDCVDQFSIQAFRDEAALEQTREKMPPKVIDNAFDRKKVFDRGILNDVATAYFVRGQAAEHVAKKRPNPQMQRAALESYRNASRLKYGRCWDPGGFFWSPAEAASDRLVALQAKPM